MKDMIVSSSFQTVINGCSLHGKKDQAKLKQTTLPFDLETVCLSIPAAGINPVTPVYGDKPRSKLDR